MSTRFDEYLSELVRDKRVLILGFGREGRSAYKALARLNVHKMLDIADINTLTGVDRISHRVITGKDYQNCIDEYDYVIKSPGIVLEIKPQKAVVTSLTEIFLEVYNRQVIGITGTKGKSTVASLLYHVLSQNHIHTLLAGNIGTPVFEITDDILTETVVILELSCHQLEYLKASPSVAVLLNIYEDHLDHYGSVEKYAASKKNIFLHQNPLDALYCDDYLYSRLLRENDGVKPPSRVFRVSYNQLPFDALDEISNVRLMGEHNYKNCAFVYDICKTFGISDAQFIHSLKSFSPLNHRLELIGNKNGVDFYDDSISTTCESAINAVCAVPNAGSILIGGMDRGIDYEPLVVFLRGSHLDNVICMYESGRRVLDLLKKETLREGLTLHYENDLYDAVRLAQKITKPGKAVILSPASASYGDFKNFEERGEVFKEIIFPDKGRSL